MQGVMLGLLLAYGFYPPTTLLQIPLFGLALSLWVMLYTWMSERRVDGE